MRSPGEASRQHHRLVSLWDRFLEEARVDPGGLALAWDGGRLEREALAGQARSLAGALAGQGMVGILLADPGARIVALLATLAAGRPAAFVPDGLEGEALERHLEGCRCRHLIVDAASGAVGAGRTAVSRLLWSGDARTGWSLEGGAAGSAGSTPPPVDPADPVIVYLTSGSTGAPRRLRRTHAQVMARVELYRERCGFRRGEHFALVTHPAYAAAEGDIFGALLGGGSLHLFAARSHGPSALSRWLRDEGVTVFHPPVSYFRTWCASWGPEDRFPRLRRLLLGGDGVPARALDGLRARLAADALVIHRLSSTETGPIAQCVHRPGDDLPGGSLPIGLPFPGVEVRLRAETGDGGQAGELLVRSFFLSPDVATDGDGFLATGDWVEWRKGQLAFLGRVDSMVKIRGFRVHLEQVEEALADVPGVASAGVVAVDGRVGGRIIVAAYTVCADEDPDETAMRVHLGRRLPPQALPARLVRLDSLPEGATGKVDRRALRRIMERDAVPLPASKGDDQTGGEGVLVRLWQEVTGGVREVDPGLPLLQQGSESLFAMFFLHELERRFGLHIPLGAFLDQSPSARDIARRLAAGEGRPRGNSTSGESPRAV